MPEALKDTLNLPRTDFPMRGNLAKREGDLFQSWDETKLYDQIQGDPKRTKDFILHDGPPYANGDIHMGHALNKILKDLVLRFKTMEGFRTPYVPGWDCHGLPIEQQILKKIGDKVHDMEPTELRKLCHEYAVGWIETQKAQFKRLGILGDWDHPYMTVDPAYEVGILTVLQKLVEKGLVTRGYKAVHWDPVFRTALAEAEIEYHTHKSPSIYVAMPAKNPEAYPELAGLENPAFIIWTTTPWTMPANLGITLHPDFDYVAVSIPGNRTGIVAAGRLEAFAADCGLENPTILRTFKAQGLDRSLAEHPIDSKKDSLVMLGEHVTLEQGTGCVHTAPGHGADDFIIGKAYGLPVFCPVDHRGCYTADFPEMEGEFVFKANPLVVEMLDKSGHLLSSKIIEHEYPYSWRSKKPIIFRATPQWFMELAEGGVREKALEVIDQDVRWIPHWGKERIRGMVERRPDWCLSRQRHWGVPIPAIQSKKTGESILVPEVLGRFIEFVRKEGTNAWYDRPLSDFIPADYTYEATGETGPEAFEKTFDILDVWFDSGASHCAVIDQDPRLSFPADLYLEGSDQHRGWFQHALLTSVGMHDKAPFKEVLTHGFVLDGTGKAMSKSMGNVISPLDLIKTYGSDILRLWVASTDYRNDVGVSAEIMKGSAETYRTIRNTFRFQIGNLYDFTEADLVPVESLRKLDRWALDQLDRLIEEVSDAFQNYEFHRGCQALNRFYNVTLSSRYHDFLKDRLYTYRADSEGRRSAQTVIYYQLKALTRMLAPILVFTADEAFGFGNEKFSSIHKADWPKTESSHRSDQIAEEMETILEVRDEVNEALEALRAKKTIGKSLEAQLEVTLPENDARGSVFEAWKEELPEIFIVSALKMNTSGAAESLFIHADKASGERCSRCWRILPDLHPHSEGHICPRCEDALNLHA